MSGPRKSIYSQVVLIERGHCVSDRQRARSAGAGAIGNGFFRLGENGDDAVSVAEVEQHAVGNFARHRTRFEVDDEQCLLADEFSGIRAFFFQTGEDAARVIAEVDGEANKFGGGADVFDAFDRADADVERLESGKRDSGFDGRWSHGGTV